MKAAIYFDGQWRDGSGDPIEVRDPSDGSTVGFIGSASSVDVRLASLAAAIALPEWAATPVVRRAEVLRRAAAGLASRSEQLSQVLAAEGGRPIREARAEIGKAIATFEYYAGLGTALDGRAFSGALPDQRHETRREPIGPVVAITPWNVPAAAPARKLAPALLAGAPVLLKPASATPLTAAAIVEAVVRAGAPPNSVQLLTGPGATVGQTLVDMGLVAAVSFTGSTEVGLELHRQLAGRLVRTQLELGGKNAAIVLADADLDRAAGHIVAAAFTSAGQQCTATSRVIVEWAVAGPLTEAILSRTAALTVGPTSDEATDMGPLIDRDQVDRTAGYIARAVAEGATVSHGGHRIDGPGCYHQPTVLTGVHQEMEIAREEVFGPVLSILEVESPDEAAAVLDDTPYGLSAAVHTRDLGLAQRLADRIDCGVVAVNGPTAGIEVAAPFGGFKMSGTATKEHGSEALDFYTRLKLVSWQW